MVALSKGSCVIVLVGLIKGIFFCTFLPQFVVSVTIIINLFFIVSVSYQANLAEWGNALAYKGSTMNISPKNIHPSFLWEISKPNNRDQKKQNQHGADGLCSHGRVSPKRTQSTNTRLQPPFKSQAKWDTSTQSYSCSVLKTNSVALKAFFHNFLKIIL